MAMAAEGKWRCAQCTFVVLDIFPKMLQDILAHTNIQPSVLYRMTMNHNHFRKQLKTDEMNSLQSLLSDGFRKLDVNLLYKIFRSFHLINPPTRRWGACPLANEIELGDDIERIRRARNHLCHKIDSNVSETSYTEFFENILAVSERLDTYLNNTTEDSSYKTLIENYNPDALKDEKLHQDRINDESYKQIAEFCLESPRTEVKIVIGKAVADDLEKANSTEGENVVRLQIKISGVNDSEDVVNLINSVKDKLSTEDIKFKGAEKGCIILFAEVKNKDPKLFMNEVTCLIRKVFLICKLACKADQIAYAIITYDEEEFDEDNLVESEEEGPSIFGNDDSFILHVDMKKSAFATSTKVGSAFTEFFEKVVSNGNGTQLFGQETVHAVLVPEEKDEIEFDFDTEAALITTIDKVDEHEDEHTEIMSRQLKSLVIPESQKKIINRGQDKRKFEKVREESISFKRRLIFNWKLLKESLLPVDVIDSFISQELVEADLWDYIKNKSRRSQMDSILSNVVKNIETSDDYNTFETIVTTHQIKLRTPRSELFIPTQGRLPDQNLLRENRELIEKELYPKDHIDSFLECFIISIEDHEELRNKENVRQHMANSFLQKILEPIAIKKGAMAYLIESFQKDKTCILRHLLNVMGDRELQTLIQMRDSCRNSIISKWTYLKENFYPHKNLIDELCSGGLVDEDRSEIIKEKPRREQVYSTLRNIVRRIDGPQMFSKLVSILKKESSFIAEKLEETSHKSVLTDVAGAKNYSYRNLSGLALQGNIHRMFYIYKDDIAKEFYPTDVDTFMDKLVFDVDDHEIICETGNDENEKAWRFYDKISDTKYIQKGSLDCLVFCLRNNEKLKKSRQTLADSLLLQHIPNQVKNRTAIASRATDCVLYPENTSKFTEGVLKLTVDDLGSKDKLEHEIFKVVETAYQNKEIGGLKLEVKGTESSPVVVHLKSNSGNAKLIVEKGIVNGDLSSFIQNLLDDENIKMHMIPGHTYTVSVSLHSKDQPKLFSGVRGSRKMRIIKANRELLEEEYDPMPLLKSVFEENVKKYKSVEDLSPQYVTGVFRQLTEINKVPERRKRVKQFMDMAEYMIDADTLWGLIEDTANLFSVKKLRDNFNDVISGQENIKLSVACSKEGLVFEGRYEVWITEEDVKSPLQSMIVETNLKYEKEQKHLEDMHTLLESIYLETRCKKEEEEKNLTDVNTSLESMNPEIRQKWEEREKHLKDMHTLLESMNLEPRREREENKRHLKEMRTLLESMNLKPRRKRDMHTLMESMNLEPRREREERKKHLKDMNTLMESINLEPRRERDMHTSMKSIYLETRWKMAVHTLYESMNLEPRRERADVNTSLEWLNLETRQKRDTQTLHEMTNLETRRKMDMQTLHEMMILKTRRKMEEEEKYLKD